MHLPILSLPHNCTKKKTPSVGLLPPASHFLSARLFSAAPVTHSRSHSGVSPGCTNSFTPIFYSAFHYNLLLLLRLHYHINYRLSHTRWFPLVSHLHQVDNASTSLNYSADNLNQREPIHILNARLLLERRPRLEEHRLADHFIHLTRVFVCQQSRKSTADFTKRRVMPLLTKCQLITIPVLILFRKRKTKKNDFYIRKTKYFKYFVQCKMWKERCLPGQRDEQNVAEYRCHPTGIDLIPISTAGSVSSKCILPLPVFHTEEGGIYFIWHTEVLAAVK